MVVQPTTARLSGGDSQVFVGDSDQVTWIESGKSITAKGRTYLFQAPPKHKIWFSREIVLLATLDGNSAGSAVIALSSSPAWIATLSAFFVLLFLSLVIGLICIWPPAPVSPRIDISPRTVTIAPGFSQQFDARIMEVRNQRVTWSATDGLITPNGLFTAPSSGSRVIVTAASSDGQNLTQTALVLLNPRGLSISPSSGILRPDAPQSFQALDYERVSSNSTSKSTDGAPSPAPSYEWSVSDQAVRLIPGANGTVEARSSAPGTELKRLVVTVIDKADRTRQASAVLYVSPDQAPLDAQISSLELAQDEKLIKLVLLMGALGALLGAARSLGNFVGNDAFVPRWSLFYVLRPAFGAGLALLVFFGYRIGAVTAFKGVTPADPFAAAFVAGMVGLFADTVLQKLKDLITAVFPTQDERKDKFMPVSATPEIDLVNASVSSKKLTVKGKNFAQGAVITLDGKARSTLFISANELALTLDALDQAGAVKVAVSNPGKQASAGFPATIGS